MEKKVKSKNKKKILIILIIFIFSIGMLFIIGNSNDKCKTIFNKHEIFEYSLNEDTPTFLGIENENATKYEIIDDYIDYQKIKKEFKEYINSFDSVSKVIEEQFQKIENEFNKDKYDKEFFEKNNIVLIESTACYRVMNKAKLEEVSKNDSNISAWLSYETSGIVAGKDCALYFIEIKKEDMKGYYTFNVNVNTENNSDPNVFKKPVIYLYPESNTNIRVKLGQPEKLLCSYPLYKDNGWEVNAESDGLLTYLESGRKLYSLYYESENIVDFNIEEDGFVIKGQDTVNFLEEKLEILGLNEIEAEEFIIYWLPILEANEYNYIRFATIDEINANMELDIQPKPDSLIRVLMTFKGLKEPINVNEQKLMTPERNGFVAVEWGGTEIRD